MVHRLRLILIGLVLLAAIPGVGLARPAAAIATTTVREGNLREQPSTSARIVAGLPQGTAVSAAARSGDWARVTVTRTGARGWMIRSLLSLSNQQFSSLPVEGGQAAPPPSSSPGVAVRGTTILLAGIDRRPGEKSARADAILVLRLDPAAGAVSLLSLPRDLYVRVPGVGNTKINAGYQYGGLALQKQTVSEFLGVRLDYAVSVNFGGFEQLIDTLGGVTINVPRRLVDPAYPTANYGTMRVVFDPGVQKMNGARALIYSRMRHPDSDFGRMYRQQQMMSAIGERLRAMGVGGTAARANEIAGLLSAYVLADIPLSAMGGVLLDAWNSGGAARMYVVDQRYVTMRTINGASVLVPNRAAVQQLVNQWAGR